ncbi:MAG: hypothetical protein ACRDJC_09470 [Thermomicrobiales bacterium]
MLPPEMLPVAALLGFALSWPRLRLPTPAARLFLEVFATGLFAALVVSIGWALLWLIEQRW